jgi:hypothetical protein
MHIEAKLKALGLTLPEPLKAPPGMRLPFAPVLVRGDRAYIADDLDRVKGWLRVFGMVNSAPGFKQQPMVINGFSDLILEFYGPEVGQHARSAVGMAELPTGIPVVIEAEVEIGA